jgi:SpoVK/Ycf46/Vps4 family AAA+-type ATPase
MAFTDELSALLAAKVPLLHLVTYEEIRVVQALAALPAARELGVVTWDLADGFTVVRQGKETFPNKECTTDTLLPHLAEKLPAGYLVVLRDFHHAWKGKPGYTTRKLRNMAPVLRSKSQYLIITTPEAALPIELKDDVVSLRVPLPVGEELRALFDEVTGRVDKSALPRPEVKEKLIGSALGLTTTQARLAFSRVWAQYRCFDDKGIALVTSAKREVVKESGALEFWPAEDSQSMVGGLDQLKSWLTKRERGFSEEARAARLPFPRGVALIGIPGTGKSLTAKMASGLWKLPLLRLDVGALFGSLLGESEEHMRKAINLAETVSPCILWIDEMEKAFSGASSGALTGGAATRLFGTFLTWMQEHTSPVFVIATANDIDGLPPELMGRFDRIFFLDLPTDAERREIFLIHLQRAGVTYPERSFRLDELVRASRGFVGREIERVVREAQFTAFADENREMEMDDLRIALTETVPLSKSHSEIIDALRKWKTEGRAFPASSDEQVVQVNKGSVLEPL